MDGLDSLLAVSLPFHFSSVLRSLFSESIKPFIDNMQKKKRRAKKSDPELNGKNGLIIISVKRSFIILPPPPLSPPWLMA